MRRRAVATLAAALVLAGGAAALAGGAGGPLRAALVRAAKGVLGYPAWRWRAARRPASPPGEALAASQVGYGPRMAKRFTSPRPFGSFQVLREADGAVAYQGGGPERAVATSLLGSARTVWIGDLSALRTPGRYRIVAAGLASQPFDVEERAFDPAVRAVQRAFYFQRAFAEVTAAHAEGPWIHPSDADRAPPGEARGWHDAGDLSVYNASTASALFWLLQAYADFEPAADDTNIPESGNGVPDLLDEARWGLEWMLSVQEPSGGFRNTTCLERYGPYGTNSPERVAAYRSGEVGTLATGRAVGVLAYAAALFRRHDPSFATRCERAARAGYAYLEARPGEHDDGPTCPAFRQDGDARAGRDVRMLAAAGMLLATGERRFLADFEAAYQGPENDPSYLRPNVYAALLYLRSPSGDPARRRAIRQRLGDQAALARADGEAHPYQWAGRYFWGSLGAAFQRGAGFNAPACLEDPVANRADCDQALANVHYAFGRNSLGLCYVSGLRGVTRGRTHAFHHWLAALGADPYLFPGLVAGGPMEAPPEADASFPHARPIAVWGYWGDPAMPRDSSTPIDGRYTDNDSWSTNEVDIDWQAVTLYNLYLARWLAGRPEAPDGPRSLHPAWPGPARITP